MCALPNEPAGTGPTGPQVDELSKEFAARADLPAHVVQMINNFPAELHPMAQLSAGMRRRHLLSRPCNVLRMTECYQ